MLIGKLFTNIYGTIIQQAKALRSLGKTWGVKQFRNQKNKHYKEGKYKHYRGNTKLDIIHQCEWR